MTPSFPRNGVSGHAGAVHVGGKGDVKDLFGIINAGYKPSGTYLVNEQGPDGQWQPVQHPVFGAVVLAGINPDLPPAFLTRALMVHLSPDVYGEAEETDWEVIGSDADALGKRLAGWANTCELRPGESMPEGVKGRMRELWRPLKRLANAAGGEWPERCDGLMRRALEWRELEREEGMDNLPPNVMLVRDIYGLWHLVDPEDTGFAITSELLDVLRTYAPDVWGDRQPNRDKPLTAQAMGRMLSKQGIRATRRYHNGEQRRGYEEQAFHRAWLNLGLQPAGLVLLQPSDVA